MRFRRLTTGFLCLCISLPLMAFGPKQTTSRDALRIEPTRVRLSAAAVQPGGSGFQSLAASEFLERHGGQWLFRADSRTDRFTAVQGSGIPLIPGRGNQLGSEALSEFALEDGELTLGALEPRIRQFIESNGSMLLPARGELVLNGSSSMIRDRGRLMTFHFDWQIDDIPVEGAAVYVRLNSGNITQFGAPFIGAINLGTRPRVESNEALQILVDYTGDQELYRLQSNPELVIMQGDDGSGGIEHQLAWNISYRVKGLLETWEGRIDAHSGELLSFRDTNLYARAVGGVYPRTVLENNETVVPMPSLNVTANSSTVVADSAGAFAYSGGAISSGLNGLYFDTNCQGCSNPPQPNVQLDGIGTGRVDFGIGGDDEVGSGNSTAADRNSFYHLTKIRELTAKWISTTYVNQLNYATIVNIANTCNAVYTGNVVNFYRSGGGCNNTGEIADVMYHEYGHGVDLTTNGGDGASGEATADVVSMQMTRSPLVGPGFNINGDPVRNLDQDTSIHGLLTVGNLLTKCSCTGNQTCGPLGGEVHCEGEIYGQVAWELGETLAAKHGPHTGWRESERIFFNSLFDAQDYLPTGSQPIYDAYVQADDDDGNLANGTPNGQEIFDVFNLHGMANAAVGNSASCLRPTQPGLIVTPQCASFDLSWDSIAAADHYEIFRTELIENQGYFPLATVSSGQTTYTDSEVAPGIDYYYVVMAVNGGGCESTVDSPVQGMLPAQPVLSLTAAAIDDTPAGNQSGFADPGEAVNLSLLLQNFGQQSANALSGTLTSPTAGVTIELGDSDFDNLAPGQSGANLDALRFSTDDAQVSCGQTLDFSFNPEGASGCTAETSFFNVQLGAESNELSDDFESDLGWQHDAGSSTAATGNWTLGDPEATGHQPGDDVTPSGSDCWFTAPNPGGGDGTDDVDDGMVVLLSPIYDLSAVDDAIVSYYRWFSMSEVGTDVGDFFRAEISDDGGSGWTTLELLDNNSPAPAWQRRSFRVEDFVSLTTQMRFRFSVADGIADGSIVEAAIDEFSIDRFVCDTTPACFNDPSFSGLTTVVAGSSCGEVDLSWNAATSNCVDGEISYNIYRDTTPGFVPGAGTLVASGITALGMSDTLLDPGTTYYYVVRADDSRSGEDSNLVEGSAVPPSGPDSGPPIFAGLESLNSGGTCGETVLNWSPALESCNNPVEYDIHRSATPGFTPDASNLVASTLGTSFVDAGITPGADVYYVVRSRDGIGNADGNSVELSTQATILDFVRAQTSFEPDADNWTVGLPNSATDGNWQWGNPVGSPYQPEDDATDAGVNCWITGVTVNASNGDVDGGTTTLLSRRYNMVGATNPVVRYNRWFTNDQGGSPGDATDDFVIDVSNDDGANWTPLESVGAGLPLEWLPVELPIPLAGTNGMRFRFTASDLGAGSLVEAGIDDFELIDAEAGCSQACGVAPPTLCSIDVSRSGDDIVVDWGIDPGVRVLIYQVSDCNERLLVGTVDGASSFVHEGAALSSGSFNYRVTSVDSCGAIVDFCGSTDCN